jgi:hypothetical protein
MGGSSSTPADQAKRIEESCRREFAGNDSAISECQLQLLAETVDRQQGAQLGRARSGAR